MVSSVLGSNVSRPFERTTEQVDSGRREPQLWQQLFEKMIGSWVSRAIYAAAKLRIADHLAAGPRSAEEIAAAFGVAPRPLYRVLRALAAAGVFAQQSDGRFRLNPAAELLREDRADSMWATAIMLGEEQDRCWGDLIETVRTGEPAFERLFGLPVFDYLEEHPEQARIFDAAMTGFSGRETGLILEAYDLSDVRTLADIGGGSGSKLAGILSRYPAMRGLLFDLPHVVERARPLLEGAGLLERCEIRAGDFFESAPVGADAYVLGHIIHDWDDAKAGRILNSLRRAMSSGARLLVVEHVIPDVDAVASGNGGWLSKWLDLHMMVAAGGLERTEAEFRRLFAEHGFRLTRVVPTSGDVSIIEGVPS
jgi:hypothetical protein